MATSFGALSTDFYVNQKLSLKMDLPSERDTVLHFFDRVRKTRPAMSRFRRYEGELALESSRRDAEYAWLALRRTSVRTGHVNPQSLADALRFHQMILELTPHYLSVTPLDVDFLEVMFGFDLECKDNHDEIIYDALFADSKLGELLKTQQGKVMDVQPVMGMSLNERGDLQAYYEVKSRPRSRRGSTRGYRGEPISLFLTLRQYGPIERVEDLPNTLETLMNRCEELATDKLVPDMLMPIARLISARSAGS
ncbi:hypothetical protein [Mucisphaera calidilacus]|uniref:Uncharacterized protein n=1 Tax=Mucisphaera calidilacus TaxID=2527982 RepID=A0A518C165_9BACT|nr:hypothetical protein [Mucisphaera calidilacus]QDU72962.1 hypothetical protein Pan265_28400 [Mucisphaera calidilacus]